MIQIFEPASERGTPGVEELQQQTVSLLSFKSMPKKIFDQQLSFNMLARYGEDAPVSLESGGTAHRAPPGHPAFPLRGCRALSRPCRRCG